MRPAGGEQRLQRRQSGRQPFQFQAATLGRDGARGGLAGEVVRLLTCAPQNILDRAPKRRAIGDGQGRRHEGGLLEYAPVMPQPQQRERDELGRRPLPGRGGHVKSEARAQAPQRNGQGAAGFVLDLRHFDDVETRQLATRARYGPTAGNGQMDGDGRAARGFLELPDLEFQRGIAAIHVLHRKAVRQQRFEVANAHQAFG